MKKSLFLGVFLFACVGSHAATVNYVVTQLSGSHFGRAVSAGASFSGVATLTTVPGGADEFDGARFDVVMDGVEVVFSDTGSIVQVSESFFAIGTGGPFGFTIGGHTISSCITIVGPDRCDDYLAAEELLQGQLTSFPMGINFFLDMQGFEPIFPDGPAFYTRDIDLQEVAVPVPAAFWLFVSGLLGLVRLRR